MANMIPIVAIVGRPNVGKSTLFNKLLGRRKAIVHNTPGVTRDLNYGDVVERDRTFTLVDTGGFESYIDEELPFKIREQAQLAIETADLIIFLMDVKDGVMPVDIEMAGLLRRVKKPVIYAVNKVDSEKQTHLLSDFYTLGITDIIAISSEHSRGIDELLDRVIAILPEKTIVEKTDGRTKIAIVGKPNVGKSSLVNSFLGYKRCVVSELAGTTTDSLDTPLDYNDSQFLLIDTAGIRRKARVGYRLEGYCIMEAIRSIDKCDIAVLVLDATDNIFRQDERIAGLISNRSKGCILLINKWDIVEKDQGIAERYKDYLRLKLNFLDFAPVLFVSAKTGSNVKKTLKALGHIGNQLQKRIATPVINKSFKDFMAWHKPPSYKGKEVKIKYITQKGGSPPTFIVFVNYPQGIKDSYERYLINKMRESLDLKDVPIRLLFRK